MWFFGPISFFHWMGPLQLSDHVVQNRQTGEQMTHWAMLNKENSNLVVLFNMSQCVIAHQFGTTWSLSCKGPIILSNFQEEEIKKNVPDYVITHGILSKPDLEKLLKETKVCLLLLLFIDTGLVYYTGAIHNWLLKLLSDRFELLLLCFAVDWKILSLILG